MRKKLILSFIMLVLIPIVILYFASYQIFEANKREYLQVLTTKNISNMENTLDDYFEHPIDLSMYPFVEPNLLSFLKATGNEKNYYQINQNAYTVLNNTPYASSSILSIDILSSAKQELHIGTMRSSINVQDIQNADKANGTQVWAETRAPDQSLMLTICRLIRDTSDTMWHLGYVKITVSTNEIQHLLCASNDIPGICYYVTDEKGRNIADSDNAKQYQKLRANFRQNVPIDSVPDTISATVDGKLYFISSVSIKKTPYMLHSIVPAASVFNIQGAILKGLGLTAVMVVLFGIFLAIFLSKLLVQPLKNLSSMTETVAAGDFSRRLSVGGNDEIAGLARQFNAMTERLEHLYNEVYRSKLKQQQAELSALLSKINPHFLHNTLDAIYWMSESGDCKRVSKMISALSVMMRYNISDDSYGDMTPLYLETNCLKSYLYIQQVRYGDNIQFLTTIEPGLENCMVLNLILQPIVENAIVHGVAPVGMGIVNVLIYREQDKLIYEVRNTGQTVEKEKLHTILTSAPIGTKGFALKNISDRLHLKFGESGRIEADSDGIQTIFKVYQPYLPQPLLQQHYGYP